MPTTEPLGALIDRNHRPRRPRDDEEVWNLNLDQIESHSGRVLARRIVNASDLGPSTFAFDRGTVLYSKLRPYLNKVVVADDGGVASTELVPIRCDASRLDAHYLAHFLRGPEFLRFATNVVAGAKMPRMVMSEFWKFPVPLPPLPEQRRIAAILDQADALRAKRREALAQLDGLTRSIFLEMFGPKIASLGAWEVRRLDEVTECLDRLRRPVTESERKPGVIPYYGANGQQGWIDTHLFDESLVLVAEDGGHFDNPSRGVAYRVDGKSWVNNHAHILRPNKDVLDVEYLHRALRHFDFRPYISGTTRAKLTQGQLNGVPLVVPPIASQRRFAERVYQIERLQTLHKNSLDELDNLFASLQHRAFAGQL